MPTYILPLADQQANLETVGGKGLSLALMAGAGLPVPNGFHVTTAAYRDFVAANDLQARILEALDGVDAANPASLEPVSQAIGRLFSEGQMPPAIAQAISAAYEALEDQKAVAVRSSATAEDLPGASFAGQQETYLNIRGSAAVLEAVKKCWASLWTGRAIAYRAKNQIDHSAVTLAVVVQELVFAEAAGILFTANPINGKRGQALINAAWGLGEAIVSGAVTPDTLTVDQLKRRLVQREIAEKRVMTVRTAAGVGEQPVPAALQKKPALSNAQALELAGWGAKIEAFYGMPMDIEWTLAGGKFAIVQARPITALPPEWAAPIARAVYARGSLAEHTPNPVSPLFATLGLEQANLATWGMWERVMGAETAHKLLTESGFYILIHGYVYGGMHMNSKTIGPMIQMSFKQIGPMFRDSVARWQAARTKLAAAVQSWENQPLETLSPSELLAGAQALFGAACRYFTDIQTTLPAASSSEVLFTTLYTRLLRRKGDPEASLFLLGFETTSLRSEKSLYDLAQRLKANPALAEYVLQTGSVRLQVDLAEATPPAGLSETLWAEWRAGFRQHLNEFGRTAYDFDFASPTPLENPGPMLEALQGYLTGQARNPYERQRQAIQKRQQATEAVLKRSFWPLKGWFEKLLHWAQETAPMREDAIFDMGLGHPRLRQIFAELGRRFAAGGALESAEEIYWLEQAEVESLAAALEAGQPLSRFSERIPERKAQWQAQLKLSPPVLLPERSGWSKLMHGGEAEKRNGKTVLKGIGTSSGSVTAPACVLFGPEDFGKMKPGDVLVAVTTTPAWTPLFALAAAVVTDIGGPLSHSSIVAREYGIPAVMAARGATHQIQNGQVLSVNGATGEVILEL